MSRVHSAPSLIRLGELEADGSPVFDPMLVERYLERLDRAKLSTLVAAHVTGGGVNRGTEFLSGKIHNDRLGIRNYHFMDRMVAYHTTYLKTRASGYAHDLNIRAYPERVTILFLKWSLAVKPLEEFLVNKVQGRETSLRARDYFANSEAGFLRTEHFSDTLQLMTHKHIGRTINLRQYRQIVKMILRDRVAGEDMDAFCAMDEENGRDDVDLQFNHSNSVAAQNYGVQ
ncbi:hypothetical protein DACRYDRAFT_24904 [Dacryopinax primogenitus]|uniref:Uncharacterized protein n=1 Tax=Dacryopinax primogenitus (strain DJM 731) TaxID=1858805 RepID=M5FNI0_DACPD|nr:uncharacterized protein DACRYDRAFT_24904 [Dacryopinax primogenitus]EJT97480.1 hypothetical protein DACRYDRAFT_24904 [Dacryopinax primogenitus]